MEQYMLEEPSKSCPEFPALFHANVQCIKYKKQKQCTVHWTDSLYQHRVVKEMLHWYRYQYKHEQ